MLVGGLVAAGAFLIRRKTEDPVLETVVSLVTPYAAYVLAESVAGSGVTAVVVASVILGTQATRITTARIRLQLGAVFGTVVFLLESVVFGLIGLQLPELVRRLGDASWVLPALMIAATLLPRPPHHRSTITSEQTGPHRGESRCRVGRTSGQGRVHQP